MSFARRTDPTTAGVGELPARAVPGVREERRSVRPGVIAAGTLACRRCDAPIGLGSQPLSLTARLICPFCSHHAPVRDFLSLSSPTRPARVVIRVTLA